VPGLGAGLTAEGEGATTVPLFDFALEAIFKPRAGAKKGMRGGGRAGSADSATGRSGGGRLADAPPAADAPQFTRDSPSRDDFRF